MYFYEGYLLNVAYFSFVSVIKLYEIKILCENILSFIDKKEKWSLITQYQFKAKWGDQNNKTFEGEENMRR